MSQVRKLKNGSLLIDGVEFEATPEFINEFNNHLNTRGATTLGGLTSALQSGRSFAYDSPSNTLVEVSKDGSTQPAEKLWFGTTDKQDEKRKAGQSNWRKFWDAQFNRDAHVFRNDLTALGSFRYQTPKAEENPNDLRDISSDKQWFEFTKGEDGKEKWNDSVYNASLLQRINDMSAYLKDPEAGKKAYRLGSGYTDAYMQAFQNLYNQDPANWDTRINEIIDRLKNGTYSDADRAFLNNFFIAKPDPTAEDIAAGQLAADKKRFADAGFDYDKWSPYITWNSDKNYWNVSEAGQEAFRSAFGGNGNYWFNDNFIGSKYNPTGALDFLNGYFVLGDRIYKQSDAEDPASELSQILRRNGGFRDLNAGMRHNEANALIEQLWGTPVEWEAPTGEYYSDWLDPNGNVYYRSRTGDYNWTGKDNNQQLVEWIAANPELADAFGYYTPQFKLTDKNGNELNKYGPEAIAGLTQLADSQRYESPFHRNKLWYSENGNSDFDGRYFLGDGYDDEGNVTGAGFWINPNDPNGDWIFESDEMKSYVPDIEGNTVRVPKEMVAILASNPDFIEKFQNDESGFRSKFAKVMAGAVGRGINFSTFMANAGPQAWMNLGFDKDTARKLAQMSRNYSQNQRNPFGMFLTPIKSNRGKRRAERMVHKPALHKDGGKVEKAAYGEMMGRSSGSAATPTQVKTDKPIRDTREFTNFGKGVLQPHDYIELGAVLADATSIGLAFNPATSIASGVTGIAGSTAGFLADVKRDGFQGSDLGQYGINLGLDALSFIPVLGGATKSLKVLNGLKKAAPIVNKIMKAAALYGIPHAAVQSWDAIQSGNFNMRDLRAVVNAVGGAVHMSRAGFRKPVRGEASIEYPTINLKAGKEGNPIKLTESQFNTIQKANPKTKEELAEQIGKLVNKTKEQVLDEYNLTDFINHRDHRFGLFGKEVNKVKLNVDKKKGEIQWQDMSKNPKRVQEHETYLANLAGRQPMSRVTNTVETITEPGIPTLAWKPKYKTTGSTIPARTEKYVMPDGTVKEVRYPGISDRRRVIVNEADKALSVPVPMIEKQVPRTIVENVTPRLITPITSSVVWERQPDPLQSPAEAIAPQITYTPSRARTWKSVAQPVFRKKGGKIAKAGLGINTDLLNVNFKDKLDIFKAPAVKNIVSKASTPSATLGGLTASKTSTLGLNKISAPVAGATYTPGKGFDNFSVTNPMTGKAVSTGSNKEGNWQQVGDVYGTPSDQPHIFDGTMLFNGLNAAVQLGLLKKQLDRAKSVAAPQYQTFYENSRRFTGSPEADKLNDLSRSILIGKDTSSDSWENKANALNRQLASNNYKLDTARELSKAYGQNIALNEEAYIRNQERGTNMANQSTELRYRKDLADAQMDSAAIAKESEILNSLAYAGIQHYNQGLQSARTALAAKSSLDDTMKYGQDYLDRISEIKSDDVNAAEKIAAAKNERDYQQQLSQIQSHAITSTPLYLRSILGLNKTNAPTFVKKGGKVESGKRSAVTYSRDPYPELLLQNAKDSTEIVKQLNDAVIKLLLQTKPINVH